MKLSGAILLCILLLAQGVFAQEEKHAELQVPADSTVNKADYVKSNQFYDALQARARKSRFTDLLVNAIVRNNDWKGEGARHASEELINETAYFAAFEGREIANIYVLPSNIYSDSLSNFFMRTVNALHQTTRESVITRHLLFKVGDKVDPQVMVHNEEVIRSLGFISDAYILVQEDERFDGAIDVYVYSRDYWSISPEVGERTGEEYWLSAYDNNFLGLGHRFTLGTYFRTSTPYVNGYILGYNVENLYGTFISLRGRADMSYSEYTYQLEALKPFIKRTDYAFGSLYKVESVTEGLLLSDTALPVQRQTVDFWGGLTMRWTKDPFHRAFLSGRWNNLVHQELFIEDVNYDSNPYYHNATTFLLSAGLFGESFYRGSHIYGFANSEDIPYGYKFELTAGYRWGEFSNNTYFGARFSAGHVLPFGYLSGNVNAGSFYDMEWEPWQSVATLQLNYFTNLVKIGSGSLRNFIKVNYTTGFNRSQGERERVILNNIRILSPPHAGGLNRATIGLESVYFSSLYFYNFRFAFYAFSDMGWLGDNYNVFRNDFSMTLGAGVRIKNDRLIFTSFQLQLGFAVLNPSGGRVNFFRLDNEPRANEQRYTPSAPAVVEYR